MAVKTKKLSTAECLGSKLHTWRKNKGYSLQKVADKLDVSVSVISQWERGLRFPSLKNIDKLAEYMDLKVWQLFKPE
jgi:transcriptional regulator with XRE-family HTH domain